MKLLHVVLDGSTCTTLVPRVSLPQLIRQIEETDKAPHNLCPDCRKHVVRFLQEKKKSIERMMQENSNKSTSHLEKAAKSCSKLIETLEKENNG